jgi:hypothetical protein
MPPLPATLFGLSALAAAVAGFLALGLAMERHWPAWRRWRCASDEKKPGHRCPGFLFTLR